MSQNSTSHTLVSVGPPVAADNVQTIDHNVEMSADDTQSLAERRTRRMDRRLPARYRDVLPQPPPPMAAPSFPSPLAEPQAPLSVSSQDFSLSSSSLRVLRFFTTLANSFGLSCRYYGDRPPSHDPEIATTFQDLTLIPPIAEVGDSAASGNW